MATFKSFVIFTAAVICCLIVQYIDATTTGPPTTGALLQPCSDIPWNESFLDKVYYILHSEDPETYTYTDVSNKCKSIQIQKLVVDSLAENDFIVEMMKKYRPGIESKVFLACPSDPDILPMRIFKCRGSEAIYKEGNDSSQGFWNWRGGKPANDSGICILLDTEDGAWSVSDCGSRSNFIICQCRRGIPAGTYVSTRFHERSFGSKTCLKSELAMRMVSVDNFIKCAMECQSDGHCASFNLRTQGGITSQLICQLSLYHSSIVPDTKFIRDRNCKYYERVR